MNKLKNVSLDYMDTESDQNQNNSTDTQRTIKLNDIEAQITNDDKKILVKKDEVTSDDCCAKACFAFTISALLSPFAICDLYYATTDNSCITQSQTSHNLVIIMKSYLMASGIIMFIIIGAFNFALFALDLNVMFPSTRSSKREDDDDITCCANICLWIFRAFDLSWLILGCVLFWEYTDIASCSQTVHDYLFARFILALISYVGRIQQANQNNN